jgi:hypothetical protein
MASPTPSKEKKKSFLRDSIKIEPSFVIFELGNQSCSSKKKKKKKKIATFLVL